MKIKNFFEDLAGYLRISKAREKNIEEASSKIDRKDPIGDVAKALHHGEQPLVLREIFDENLDAKTFRFSSNVHLPYFKPGQYISLKMKIGDSLVSRPYSICSSPLETRGNNGYIDICVKRTQNDALVSKYLLENAKVGDEFSANIGLGQFYYEQVRDNQNIVTIAGGSGITPFISMIKAVLKGTLSCKITLLYGCRRKEDILFKNFLDSIVNENVRIVYIISDEEAENGTEKGFIDSNIIQKYSPEECSYFVCGPLGLYNFVKNEFEKLGVPKSKIRFEVFSKKGEDCDSLRIEERMFRINIQQGIDVFSINANSKESILVALERAGLYLDNGCRSGSCGFCRFRLIDGDVKVIDDEGRRFADKQCGYYHACVTYPLSDLVISIPIC